MICDIWVDILQAPSWVSLQYPSINHSVYGHNWLHWYDATHQGKHYELLRILQNFTEKTAGFGSPRRKTRALILRNPHATDLANLGSFWSNPTIGVRLGWKMLEIILANIRVSVNMFGMSTSGCKKCWNTSGFVSNSTTFTTSHDWWYYIWFFCPHFPNGDTASTVKSTARMFSGNRRIAKDYKKCMESHLWYSIRLVGALESHENNTLLDPKSQLLKLKFSTYGSDGQFMMIIIELGAMLGPKNLLRVSRSTCFHKPE